MRPLPGGARRRRPVSCTPATTRPSCRRSGRWSPRVERYLGRCPCSAAARPWRPCPRAWRKARRRSVSILAQALYLRFTHAISYRRLTRLFLHLFALQGQRGRLGRHVRRASGASMTRPPPSSPGYGVPGWSAPTRPRCASAAGLRRWRKLRRLRRCEEGQGEGSDRCSADAGEAGLREARRSEGEQGASCGAARVSIRHVGTGGWVHCALGNGGRLDTWHRAIHVPEHSCASRRAGSESVLPISFRPARWKSDSKPSSACGS